MFNTRRYSGTRIIVTFLPKCKFSKTTNRGSNIESYYTNLRSLFRNCNETHHNNFEKTIVVSHKFFQYLAVRYIITVMNVTINTKMLFIRLR